MRTDEHAGLVDIPTDIGQIFGVDQNQAPPHTATPPVFALIFWVLGLVVLCQLFVAGVALAKRFDAAQEVRIIEKEVVKYVAVEMPPSTALEPVGAEHGGMRPTTRDTLLGPEPSPTPLRAPEIADPRAERLVDEARSARVAGDMGVAIMKLEEAMLHAPDEPAVRYEMGLVHEQMEVFDRAAEHYEAVFRAGITAAGTYYELAAAKLRDGFQPTAQMHGKLSLGRIRSVRNLDHEDGKQTILSIPVQKAPGADVDPAGIEVVVVFFNKTDRGEIQQLKEQDWVEKEWISLPIDWAGGEETLRMNYVIPKADLRTEHLFGALEYHGQVVTLLYEGEVLDVQAWPRDLAAKIPRQAEHGDFGLPPDFFDPGLLPLDFDPDNPLLNLLPEY